MPVSSLSINELVMLLALDDEEGKVRWRISPYLDYALAGGMIAELTLRQLLDVKKDGTLELATQQDKTGSPLLDDVLKWFRESEEEHTIAGAVTSLSTIPEIDHRQAEELAEKGILERREGHFLLIFPTTLYPMHDVTPEKEVVAQIREAVLGDDSVPHRLAILITIAWGARLLRSVFSKKELESREGRLHQIARGDIIAETTLELIQQAERALYIASSIPFMGLSRL